MDYSQLLSTCNTVAKQAGTAMMAIYSQDFEVIEKQDQSPLTEADLASHRVIVEALSKESEFPILSEESAEVPWSERRQWDTYWLIDPLDGTKEFIKKNGEFTVNIALIENGVPTVGVVYAPAIDTLYFGAKGVGAFKQEGENSAKPISPSVFADNEVVKIVGSRSHQSPEIQGFIDSLKNSTELVAMGSSLKLCLVAEGAAHLYPRLGPTSEWDTAAAHAVVLAAGGNVTVMKPGNDGVYLDSKQSLQYNQKESIRNPYFLVSA